MTLLPKMAVDRSQFQDHQVPVALQQQGQRLAVYGEMEQPQGMAHLQRAAQGMESAASSAQLSAADAANQFAADAISRLKLATGMLNPQAGSGHQALYQRAVEMGAMSPDGQQINPQVLKAALRLNG